jgi:predicted transcriptional regulator
VGTPKFCRSRTCGPNLDELIAVRDEVGAKAAFVHSEVFVNDKLETVSRFETTPTFRQWGLETEPWLFVVDARGTIVSRYEGALTASQIKEAVAPLLRS